MSQPLEPLQIRVVEPDDVNGEWQSPVDVVLPKGMGLLFVHVAENATPACAIAAVQSLSTDAHFMQTMWEAQPKRRPQPEALMRVVVIDNSAERIGHIVVAALLPRLAACFPMVAIGAESSDHMFQIAIRKFGGHRWSTPVFRHKRCQPLNADGALEAATEFRGGMDSFLAHNNGSVTWDVVGTSNLLRIAISPEAENAYHVLAGLEAIDQSAIARAVGKMVKGPLLLLEIDDQSTPGGMSSLALAWLYRRALEMQSYIALVTGHSDKTGPIVQGLRLGQGEPWYTPSFNLPLDDPPRNFAGVHELMCTVRRAHLGLESSCA